MMDALESNNQGQAHNSPPARDDQKTSKVPAPDTKSGESSIEDINEETEQADTEGIP